MNATLEKKRCKKMFANALIELCNVWNFSKSFLFTMREKSDQNRFR